VIIGVGLSTISRGLGGQLKALSVTGEQEALLMLARNVLVELETQRMAGQKPSRLKEGSFEAPYDAYAWSIQAESLEPLSELEASRIQVIARQESGAAVELSSVWPAAWVPQEWY